MFKADGLITRRWLVRAVTLVAALCLVDRAPAASQVATADEVKAAFLFNFAKFVDWPVDSMPAKVPFVIGVLGNEGLEEALRAIVRGKTINDRELVVKRVSSSEDLTRMHLVFVAASEKGRLPDLLKRLDGWSVLTVSDVDRFCQTGGVIALAMEDNRVRFDVNLDAAEKGRLKVSSKLLALARTVYPSKASGDR